MSFLKLNAEQATKIATECLENILTIRKNRREYLEKEVEELGQYYLKHPIRAHFNLKWDQFQEAHKNLQCISDFLSDQWRLATQCLWSALYSDEIFLDVEDFLQLQDFADSKTILFLNEKLHQRGVNFNFHNKLEKYGL